MADGRFDAINVILRSLSLAQYFFKGRNASIWRRRKRGVKLSIIIINLFHQVMASHNDKGAVSPDSANLQYLDADGWQLTSGKFRAFETLSNLIIKDPSDFLKF